MAGVATRSWQMVRDSDTQDNFLLWFIQDFGFNLNAVTALYNVQMVKVLGNT